MDPHNNHLPPFIPNPWDPPPPPPPPQNFQWGNGNFNGNGNPGFHNDAFPPFHPPFAAPPGPTNFCPPNPQFPRKRKFADTNNCVKLYVAGVPRNVTQEEIYRLFDEYGKVTEVILLPNKWTGQLHEYCFVKYALIEEADRAIAALHNQYTFPETKLAITVRYADKAKQRQGALSQGLERSVQHDSSLTRSVMLKNDSTFPGRANIGETLHKVYVNGLNKEASDQEIEEIFSPYGVVVDIYMMRDELKQRRGCGFVGFSHRDMAVAAIEGLNGNFVKGSSKPLIVRFAEPKKPKNVELRPTSKPVDMQGTNMSDSPQLGNSSTSMQANPIGTQAANCVTVANRLECPVSSEMQKPLQQPISPSRFSEMSLQHSQPLHGSPHSYRQTNSQSQTPLHQNQTSVSSREQQLDHQSQQPCRDTRSNSVILNTEPASGALSKNDALENSIECEWSEHICPDGCKYYFNCATCESRWEKPDEFALYERQLQSRQLQNHSCQEFHPSALEASAVEEVCQVQVLQNQNDLCDLEIPQLAMSCAVEHTHEQVQTENSTVGGPAFVQ